MEVAISNYLIKMTDQELGDDESHTVTELLNFVTEFERIGDYAVNIMERQKNCRKRKRPSVKTPPRSCSCWRMR